ncbi:MAG: MarR family transcriptional regulator [Ruminococcaceae bacterium]|nr:MarR family transcriptional regulator [Oscillospiraceae bacterium]
MKTEAGNFLTMRQVLYHLYMSLFEEMQTAYGMTQMEINLLLYLANNPQFDTAAQLVKNGKLSKSQVSTAVVHLAQAGYLQRRIEGRRIHLQLMPAALAVVEEGRRRQSAFSEAVFQGISMEERDILNDLMARIVENARKAEEKLCEGDLLDDAYES